MEIFINNDTTKLFKSNTGQFVHENKVTGERFPITSWEFDDRVRAETMFRDNDRIHEIDLQVLMNFFVKKTSHSKRPRVVLRTSRFDRVDKETKIKKPKKSH